jgi:radical SAM superfamily enzyme YgiQ (UPF0313 family)
MKILLVYPEMPDTFYAMKHFMKVIGKKAAYPPLGLLTIASLFPHDWEKKLIDLNIKQVSDKELLWADYVFLSAMNVQEDSAREIINRCNKLGVKIVGGGTLFTHEYDRFEGVDHFILNEAEITFPMFLNDLNKNNLQHVYKTSEFADVELSPLPAFELANMDQYLYAIVQYSRGCPYMCDFCDVTALFGRRPRTKKAAQIIAELEAVRKSGNVQLILFADDNLIGNKKILKSDLLPALIEWRKKTNPNFFFATQLTVNLSDDEELMQLMLDAGFRHIFIGIETPSEESLKVSHKNQNLKRNLLDTIHLLHQKGFIISGGFIVGFDTDKEDIFQRQVNFIQQSGIPLPIVNILKAPPGTDLYERIKSEKRLSKRFAFSEGDTNVIPVMGEYPLYKGFIEVIDNIYRPRKSYERLRQFFNTYRLPVTSVKIKAKYSIRDLNMLLRTVFRLGIADSERKYFWKLVGWSFFNNRKMLDKTLMYGVMIHQMHETYKIIHQKASTEMRYYQEVGEREMVER